MTGIYGNWEKSIFLENIKIEEKDYESFKILYALFIYDIMTGEKEIYISRTIFKVCKKVFLSKSKNDLKSNSRPLIDKKQWEVDKRLKTKLYKRY